MKVVLAAMKKGKTPKHGYIRATHKPGCHKDYPYDVIHVELKNMRGQEIEICLTPDEALLLSVQLIAAVLDNQYSSKDFVKRYVLPRLTEAIKRAGTANNKKDIRRLHSLRRTTQSKSCKGRVETSSKMLARK